MSDRYSLNVERYIPPNLRPLARMLGLDDASNLNPVVSMGMRPRDAAARYSDPARYSPTGERELSDLLEAGMGPVEALLGVGAGRLVREPAEQTILGLFGLSSPNDLSEIRALAEAEARMDADLAAEFDAVTADLPTETVHPAEVALQESLDEVEYIPFGDDGYDDGPIPDDPFGFEEEEILDAYFEPDEDLVPDDDSDTSYYANWGRNIDRTLNSEIDRFYTLGELDATYAIEDVMRDMEVAGYDRGDRFQYLFDALERNGVPVEERGRLLSEIFPPARKPNVEYSYPFSSRFEDVLSRTKQTKFGSADDFIRFLEKQGVKQSELQARSITSDDLFEGKVDLSQYDFGYEPLLTKVLRGENAEYGGYFTPGGRDYQETLVTLNDGTRFGTGYGDLDHFQEFLDDDNPLVVHLRSAVFDMDDGSRAFHLGEIQSQATQNARKTRSARNEIKDLGNGDYDEGLKVAPDWMIDQAQGVSHDDIGIGSLFTTDMTTDLALKQAIYQAIESGADYMTLGTGQMAYDMTMGKESGQKKYYDEIVPKRLDKLLRGLEKKNKVQLPRIEDRGIETFRYGVPDDDTMYTTRVPAIRITPELVDLFMGGSVEAFRYGGMV